MVHPVYEQRRVVTILDREYLLDCTAYAQQADCVWPLHVYLGYTTGPISAIASQTTYVSPSNLEATIDSMVSDFIDSELAFPLEAATIAFARKGGS